MKRSNAIALFCVWYLLGFILVGHFIVPEKINADIGFGALFAFMVLNYLVIAHNVEVEG